MHASRLGILSACCCILGFAPPACAELELQVYGGFNGAQPSRVEISHGALRDARTVRWESRSFEEPVYYGVRIAYWLGNRGVALDFTHTKAYALIHAATDPVYEELAFSHGNNLVTANALRRAQRDAGGMDYSGRGAGAAVAHVEVRLKEKPDRPTNRYELAGSVRQSMAGSTFPLSRCLHIFDETKASRTDLDGTLEDGGTIRTRLDSPQWVLGLSLGF